MSNRFMNVVVIILLNTIVFSQPTLFAQNSNWTNLFNGKDLKGWVQYNGKAKYTVENG
jgi:hypothetical protein